MEFDEIYTVDADQSETEFLRRVYINLARNSYDARVLQGTFGPVETSVMQVAGCRAHVDTTYTYDRITYVPGTVMVKEQQRYGRSWREVEVPREGQVPRNIPESGKASGDVEGYVINLKSFAQADNPDTYLFYMNYHIPEMGKMSKRLPDRKYSKLSLTGEAYDRASRTACDIVNSTATLPDEYDNLTFEPTFYLQKMICYMVPYYTVSYTLGSGTYTAKGYACGEPNVWNQCPEGINKGDVDRYAEKKTGIKAVKYLFPVLTWTVYILAIILSVCIGVNGFYTFIASFALCLIGIIAYQAASSRCNKYAAKMQPRWTTRMTASLNALFAKQNMRPLTPEEIREFSDMDFTFFRQGTTHGYHEISKYSMFTLIVLVITLVVVLFVSVAIMA